MFEIAVGRVPTDFKRNLSCLVIINFFWWQDSSCSVNCKEEQPRRNTFWFAVQKACTQHIILLQEEYSSITLTPLIAEFSIIDGGFSHLIESLKISITFDSIFFKRGVLILFCEEDFSLLQSSVAAKTFGKLVEYKSSSLSPQQGFFPKSLNALRIPKGENLIIKQYQLMEKIFFNVTEPL